jgi:hypothetical protein
MTQKVTYEARGKSVKVILADLSKISGVTLKAGQSDSDWQVRDRKMNIFAKDVPLSNLINSMARAMKFTWNRSKDEVPTYRLYMDRRTLLDAESQRLREEDRRNRKDIERKQQMLSGMDALDSLSPADLAKLKQDSPYLYLAATSGVGKSLGQFFKGSPAAMEAFASGQELTMNGSDLSPSAQQALAGTLRGMKQFSPVLNSGDTEELPSDLEARIGQAVIQINPQMDLVRSQPFFSDFVLGSMGVKLEKGGKTDGFPLLNPENAISKMLARALVKSQDEGRPINEVMAEIQGEALTSLMSQARQDDSGEARIEHSPEDPAMSQKIKTKAVKPGLLADALATLAEASHLPVVSDSYGGTFGFLTVGDSEMGLGKLLDLIADGFHYNWDKPHGVLEFRDRNWFTKRAAQIPEAWIEGWKKTLRDTGTLDISDLTQIAMLTLEQCNVNLQGDEELARSGIPSCVYSYRDLLRACSALKESQRKAIYTEAGLDMASLTNDQWQGFEKLINSKNGNMLKNENAKLTLSATRRAYEKQFDYSFALKSSDETSPITWRFFTPKYVEPPKEEKPPAKPGDRKS